MTDEAIVGAMEEAGRTGRAKKGGGCCTSVDDVPDDDDGDGDDTAAGRGSLTTVELAGVDKRSNVAPFGCIGVVEETVLVGWGRMAVWGTGMPYSTTFIPNNPFGPKLTASTVTNCTKVSKQSHLG